MTNPEPRRHWYDDADWPGRIAFTLALGVSVGFASALIAAATARTPPVSELTATLLATLGGAMIGAVATYLGGAGMARRERQREQGSKSEEETTPILPAHPENYQRTDAAIDDPPG